VRPKGLVDVEMKVMVERQSRFSVQERGSEAEDWEEIAGMPGD